ncbi:hypothetical protein CR162_12990 [Pseudoroseomonas rhizosphaerae]|uniref:VWFA domain-containing protein n=1 Tax=Teichococcus rhizosphaerae TaxID=1335062 RepID=A0A2C6Z7V7_9PROT|nr:DUF1194 domain-containing protein [Pseudoroseomonas rhizosphaerae]PHK94591.1 hypothetical protein CR162_12990 [Pseudoroseomonas rhizosphaerae]
MRCREFFRHASAGLLAAPAILAPGRARAMEPVDVELALAVDVSRSMSAEEQELQFRGYAAAFRDPRLTDGIARGAIGAIAVCFFTWSDWNVQELLVPWTRIDGAASGGRFAAAIDAAPRRAHLYTSISAAIDFAASLFGQGYEGTRQVVDISGDGVNNSGRPLAEARAEALEKGIALNGLAVLDRTPPPPQFADLMPPLDDYYRDEVIGGTGAFLMVAEGFPAFEGAVRRKIIREIASNPPPGPLVERAYA